MPVTCKSTQLASTTSDIESKPTKKLNIKVVTFDKWKRNTTPNIELWSGFGVTKIFTPRAHARARGYVYPARAFTPRAHARARGYVIGRGVCILYIVYKSALFFGTNLLSPKILTFRGLF